MTVDVTWHATYYQQRGLVANMSEKRTVRDILTENVKTVDESTIVYDAVRMMAENNIGAVIVLNAIREPAGIFTERDLLKRVVSQGIDPKTTRISQVMTPKFVCVQTSDELMELPEIMIRGNFRHLPIVEGRKLVGILSIRDVVRYMAGL
jgi:CBS domain-containing protein